MLRLSFISVILLVLLSIEGCSKAPGLGGKATIKGKITGRFYSDTQLTLLTGLSALGDENVYLIYGNDHTFYDDDISTSYDGSFEFNYLRPGKYIVFMYENCYPCAALQQEKLFEVEITEKKQVVDLGEIILNKEQ
ncbi:MAG: hypothetical protein K9I97_02670 [Cryomorphaceae bacterium]|jgi:hypothetical protein|nr:hypothetical protein [Cryomorphaceae bacterium]